MYYKIHHIALSEVDSFSVGAGRHYIVVWSGQIPLGHIWITSPTKLADKIRAAIQPALSYYDTHGSSLVAPGKAVSLSVVICTRHRPQSLHTCLQSLLSGPDTDFELIVVDNAPGNDETLQVATQFPQVRYVREDRKGLDIARNTGARTATGNIVAYTDDDVSIPHNWITNLKACFADPLIMAVTGLVIPLSLDTRAQYIFEKKWGFNKGYLPRRFNHRYFLDNLEYGVPAWDIGAGANMAFRKEAFQVAGIFDERLDVGASGCSGDSEMWHRILAEGWDCHYVPELYVFHEHRATNAGLRKQLFGYMRGHVSALLVQHENYQHPGELKRIEQGLPHYYRQRLLSWIKGNGEEYIRHIVTEIRGCRSGVRFYRDHQHLRRQDIHTFPSCLFQPVVASAESLVSVVIPCYNHGHYLRQAIDSVLGQSHPHMEVIVVDDGSSDDTAAVCKEYGDRVQYIYVSRVGLSAARNIGIQHSHGEFLIFLDADDYLYPGAAELNLFYFRDCPHLAFVSGAHDRVDANGDYITGVYHSGAGYLSLLQGNFIGMEGCILYRRDLFFHFHFDTKLQACEDYDLNLKIARLLPTFHHKEKIAAYRIHGRNMSDNRNMMLQLVMEVLNRQVPLLSNDAERLALQAGRQNWGDYYETA
ncbi:glycosyltransferase family 2 protein [Chitinophaga silvisoli]|uniref:Glycosyltransferase n=1 Tax=Chitinophaga silvisoli TaxID=2291814 RepID=A0A3E1P7B0_9BACT|nr:glycosyltransferase family 2 protein [Chitinophaga silvisoli]RFM36052.1 glycosyltransferase [Chitinophaga silvisoli]